MCKTKLDGVLFKTIIDVSKKQVELSHLRRLVNCFDYYCMINIVFAIYVHYPTHQIFDILHATGSDANVNYSWMCYI